MHGQQCWSKICFWSEFYVEILCFSAHLILHSQMQVPNMIKWRANRKTYAGFWRVPLGIQTYFALEIMPLNIIYITNKLWLRLTAYMKCSVRLASKRPWVPAPHPQGFLCKLRKPGILLHFIYSIITWYKTNAIKLMMPHMSKNQNKNKDSLTETGIHPHVCARPF